MACAAPKRWLKYTTDASGKNRVHEVKARQMVFVGALNREDPACKTLTLTVLYVGYSHTYIFYPISVVFWWHQGAFII